MLAFVQETINNFKWSIYKCIYICIHISNNGGSYVQNLINFTALFALCPSFNFSFEFNNKGSHVFAMQMFPTQRKPPPNEWANKKERNRGKEWDVERLLWEQHKWLYSLDAAPVKWPYFEMETTTDASIIEWVFNRKTE